MLAVILYIGCIESVDFWDGSFYHKNSSPQQVTAQTILETIVISPNAIVLDIGCGAGDITENIAQKACEGKVLGIDSSSSMITFARQKYQTKANLEFAVLAAEDINFADDSFTHVTSFSALHWVNNVSSVIARIFKSLQLGGVFIGNTAHAKHFFYESVMKTANSDKWRKYFNNSMQEPWFGYDEESFCQLLCNAGFTKIELKTWDKALYFPDKQAFRAFMYAWVFSITHVRELSENLKYDFVNDAIDYFLNSISINNDGSLTFENSILLFKAEK